MEKFHFKTHLALSLWFAVFALPVALATQPSAQPRTTRGRRSKSLFRFPVAGGSDIWIRTIAPYLEKNIPGSSQIQLPQHRRR